MKKETGRMWAYHETDRMALIDGEIVPYDACGDAPDCYSDSPFEFIGVGEVYSIDGIRQYGLNDYHFFQERSADNEKEN